MMLGLHIGSALTTGILIVATVLSLLAQSEKRKTLYWLFSVSSLVTVGSGSLLALATRQPLMSYCTNMGVYVLILIASQGLFHAQIFGKRVSFAPALAQLTLFGITGILLGI